MSTRFAVGKDGNGMSETLADLGEFGFIHRINEFLRKEGIQGRDVTLAIGDDAASFQPRAGNELLVTCDCMVEGKHFVPGRINPMDLGRRAMVMNISDIGAMGGQPIYALVSLGLRADTLIVDLEAVYRGFIAELNPLEASIIGGNLTCSEHAMFIDITVIGEAEKDKVVRRSTANVGDLILVTGHPGQAAAGLKLLMETDDYAALYDHPLVRAYSRPSHRAREGHAVAQSGYATAMIDTSDGLLGDLAHICEESRVGAELVLENMPVSDLMMDISTQSSEERYELVLRDSDDYELIITCPPSNLDLIRSTIDRISDIPLTEIGRITDEAGSIKLLLPDGTQREVQPDGWNHFISKKR